MTPPPPFSLRAWMMATRLFSGPLSALSRRQHGQMGAAPERFPERLGRASRCVDGKVIWFHAASLGEVAQIGPLADVLARDTGKPILVTTTTASGADWVAREMPEAIHQFAPVDTPSAVAGFLAHWSISATIFVEGDLWPRLVMETHARGIPQILLNARPSRTRDRFPAAFGALLRPFALITCRSEEVADGIRSLGVAPERVRIMPDLKAAAARIPASDESVALLSSEIDGRPVWLAASTHPDDEEAVLTAHRRVREVRPDALLIVAPRHPQRAEPLQDRARVLEFATARRSLGEPIAPDCDVYIADTLGELGTFFQLAPVVFLGGSFGQEGGHNPYEPAHFGCAIVAGPNTRNFAAAYSALGAAGAARQVGTSSALGDRVAELLGSSKGKAMGQAGKAFMEASEDGIADHAALIASVVR
ncbi:MAG: 3-deoxy-D-manno-octulosonic acid transferase [Silicimonas sp.]|nr:3-deoxy-D-manno-octulosonic acid transferase [Silicimonas sp.]